MFRHFGHPQRAYIRISLNMQVYIMLSVFQVWLKLQYIILIIIIDVTKVLIVLYFRFRESQHFFITFLLLQTGPDRTGGTLSFLYHGYRGYIPAGESSWGVAVKTLTPHPTL
jgi:hypothetical protein